MMKVKGIFAVSFIAMMVVGGAYADIASSGYVDEKIDGLATVAKTGSYDDLADKPTIPSAYVLKAATSSALGGVKSGGDITVATSGAVTVNSATQADSATTAASATKASQDASGNVITSTYATKTELTSGLSGKQATLSGAQLNAVNSGITSTKVSTYDGYSAKITAAQDAADDAAAAAAAAQSTASGKLSSISGSTGGTGNVVTSVSASGSTVSATKGITAEETKNKVTSVRAAASATDTAYPSEKAVATALAGKANTSALSGYATTSALGAVEDKAEAAQTTANGKVTANAAITAGTATKITYDAKGLVTGGASLTASDIPTIPSTKVSGLSTVATSGSYDDLADKPSIPTVNNATLTIQKNGTNVATFTANSASAATANITVPTKTSELTNDSSFATTAQVNARVATAQGTDNANDVMVVNSSGNVAPALITNANISSSAAIAQSKISGLTDALAGKLSTTGTAAKATADANGNNIASTYATKAQITALDSTSTGTGAMVTGVSQTDGKVTVTKGNVKIPFGGQNATNYAAIWVE